MNKYLHLIASFGECLALLDLVRFLKLPNFLRLVNLPDSSLKKTYQYYGDHPKEMEEVYDALIDSLSLREQRTTHE